MSPRHDPIACGSALASHLSWSRVCRLACCLATLGLCLVSVSPAPGASLVAAGQDDGYSGAVMDKVVGKWKPPAQLKGDFRLKMLLSLDGEGNVADCKIRKSSGLQALDVSACAAARAAAPFGQPPYGMPADIHFSFWTGGATGLQPEAKEVADATHARAASENARVANERARAMAEDAAKKSGKTLNSPVPAEDGARTHPDTKKTIDKKIAPKTVAEKSSPSPAPQPATPITPGEAPKNTASSTPPRTNAPALDESERDRRYISRITWTLRNAMYVPVQTKPGVYHATVRLTCDPSGAIISREIVKGTGDTLLDQYILEGITRAGKVSPPPPGLGDNMELTFTFVRKRSQRAAAKPEPKAQSNKEAQ